MRIQNGWDSVQPARSRTFDALGAIAEGREQVQMDHDREQEVERAKMDLLRAVIETKRGVQVTAEQRADIEEALGNLHGKARWAWRRSMQDHLYC